MRRIGDYQIIEEIGRGGMAVVYKALQRSLNRPVAIKVLSGRMTRNPEVVKRFNQEALIIAKLTHPNIINVIDRGTIDGRDYFVMAYVEGTDLSKAIRKGSLDTRKKLDIVIQVCRALSYAHKNGVIHRDIKPSNILIDGDGNAMVSDFGIARLFENGEEEKGKKGRAIMGTLAYMSPEQKTDSRTVTAASDIYSLGVTMYEMFTGTLPTGGFRTPREIDPSIPRKLESIILRCMEPNPANRYGSADEIRDHLLELLQGALIKKNHKEQALSGIRSIESKFALLDIIKESRYGAVYLFEKKADKKLLVIKKVKKQKRGIYEAKLLSTLRHRNIVEVYGVSGNDKLFIIVMEYVRGGSLKERMVKTHSWREGLEIARQICDGLAYAHKNGIVHGNLRPSNILISAKGAVKVSDFSLEEHYATEGKKANWYRIPDEPRTFASDIYAAGAIFYQMLTGSVPLWRSGRMVTHYQFSLLPEDVQKLLSKMLARKPGDRFRDFGEVISVIDGILRSAESGSGPEGATEKSEAEEPPKESSFRPLRAAALFLLLLLSAAAYIYLQGGGAYEDYFSTLTERLPDQLRRVTDYAERLFRR